MVAWNSHDGEDLSVCLAGFIHLPDGIDESIEAFVPEFIAATGQNDKRVLIHLLVQQGGGHLEDLFPGLGPPLVIGFLCGHERG